MPRLLFKAIGLVNGLLAKTGHLELSAIRKFLEQVKQLEKSDNSICLVLTIDTSKPMFLAHCLVSFFRGFVSHCREVSDNAVSYILMECLVRALLDKSEFKKGSTGKLYAQVSGCRIALQS